MFNKKKTIQRLEDVTNDLVNIYGKHRFDISELKKELERERAISKSYKNRVEELLKEQEDYKLISQKYENYHRNYAELLERCKKAEKEKHELETAFTTTQAGEDVTELKNRIQELLKDRQENLDLLEKAENKVKSLQSHISSFDELINSREREISERCNKINELRAENKNWSVVRDHLVEENKNQSDQINNLRAERTKMSERFNYELDSTIKNHRNNLEEVEERFRNQIKELEKELLKLEVELGISNEQNQKLKSENAGLHKEMGSITQLHSLRVKDFHEEIKRYSDELKQLKAEIYRVKSLKITNTPIMAFDPAVNTPPLFVEYPQKSGKNAISEIIKNKNEEES